jgi:hypothetical protein
MSIIYFIFVIIAAYYLILETPDDFKYQYMWKTTDYKNNHFRFFVQAKHDVHINLSPNYGTVYYEVSLEFSIIFNSVNVHLFNSV